MQRTIDEAINETAQQIAGVINNSGLPLSVIKLIITNTLLSLQQIQPTQVPTEETEESEDAEG